MDYEIEIVNAPIDEGDPTPFYANARCRRTGRIVRQGPDAETEELAREELREIMEGS